MRLVITEFVLVGIMVVLQTKMMEGMMEETHPPTNQIKGGNQPPTETVKEEIQPPTGAVKQGLLAPLEVMEGIQPLNGKPTNIFLYNHFVPGRVPPYHPKQDDYVTNVVANLTTLDKFKEATAKGQVIVPYVTCKPDGVWKLLAYGIWVQVTSATEVEALDTASKMLRDGFAISNVSGKTDGMKNLEWGAMGARCMDPESKLWLVIAYFQLKEIKREKVDESLLDPSLAQSTSSASKSKPLLAKSQSQASFCIMM